MQSQRQDYFHGGIQKGSCATDIHAKTLDQNLKKIRNDLSSEMQPHGWTCLKKIPRENLKKFNIYIGFEPDGGLWYKNGILQAVFEGKKQGKYGNAIERWQKNHWIAKTLNPNVKYITFGVREGFSDNSYAYRYAKTMLNSEGKIFNTLYPSGQSWFVNVDGFSKNELYNLMKKSLEENIQ